jgi:ribonuclease HI
MDSKMIKVYCLIKNLQVHLDAFPDILIEMDIVVIDVLDAWGMLLLRKTAADLGGNIQMDLTYATIPTPDGAMFRLKRELERRYHVEDPRNPMNELKYKEDDFGNYAILSNSLEPIEEEAKEERAREVWYMHFDGAFSRFGKGASIVIESPSGQELKFAYTLEFDATNNVAEYEALLLGLELCKDMGVKCLNIKGDSDLVIQQLKKKFACKSERIKRYRNAIWDTMENFDALDQCCIISSIYLRYFDKFRVKPLSDIL